MQETGDIVTKRKSQGTYALVSSGNDEKTNNGDRFQIDSQTYEEFKQAYLNYAKNMESYYNEESTKFSEHVNNFLDNGAFKFYDIDFLHSSENLKDKVNKKATYENINSNGDGYKIEKDIQHDVRFLTQFKDGKEKSYRILGHKARPGGYSMIRCEQGCYSDWLDSRISWISGKGNTNKGFQTGDKAPALGDDVNFLVSPEGGLFGITEKERDDLREKAIAIKLEREKKVSNEKNIQIEGVSKLKADILNRNLDMERI